MGIRKCAYCSPAVLGAPAVTVLLVATLAGSVVRRDLPRPPAERTDYQTALHQFKAGEMEKAQSAFRELAGDESTPLLVRACSLNMVGQIARLGGEGQKAREAFGRLAALLEPVMAGRRGSADATLVRLFGAACLGRAEISAQAADPQGAVSEYERVLRASELVSDNAWLNEQSPWILDRLAHVRLWSGDLEGYERDAERLRQSYPAYERAVLLGLEAACVKLLHDSGGPAVVPQNSYDAPAWAIAFVRSREDASVRRRLLDIAAATCPASPRTCADLVACYHAAWMFETLGETGEAIRCFGQAASAGIQASDHSFVTEKPAEIIRGYARVQHAILLTETGRYDEALLALGPASQQDGQTHLTQLMESTRKNIETLRRETSNHENPNR